MGSGEGKLVCVTGGSGYIASWLVKLLLERGYSVNATVRDPTDTKKTAHLLALEGAKERLHLFKGDLLEEGSFYSAMDGCVGVFHTASPVPRSIEAFYQQEDLVDPAVKGTLNVLRSCAKVTSIERVILTSSIAAMCDNKDAFNVIIDETWYSDPAFMQEMKHWYALGKTLAEKEAWKFAEENKIDLVVLLPGFVFGPLLHPTLSASVEIFSNLINGETYNDFHVTPVDVRDVALGHIQAFEISSASGRYCLTERGLYMSEILEMVQQLCPGLRLPKKDDGQEVPKEFRMSREKAKSLGINFITFEVSLKETIESFKEKGFLSF